jgi:glycosyltransferase involved in cell wall biosynthesis
VINAISLSRILIISAVFPPEPVVSAILSKDIATSLSKDHSVVVLCPQPSRPEGYRFTPVTGDTGYEVIHLDSYTSAASKIIGRLRESYSLGKHSVEYIKKHQKEIDCIYLNSWPLASQYLIIRAAKECNIPSVIHIQDIYPESLTSKLPKAIGKIFNKLLLPVDRFILKNATKILGISENMIAYLSETRKVERSKFELVRNWQNDDQFLSFVQEKNNPSFFTFMYAGSISPSAGVETLIYAFNKANLENSKLLIAGDGAEKDSCLEVAGKLDNDDIEFLEAVPEQIAEIQSKADVLLLPLKKGISRTATPSKLTAYLLSGRPVIACVEDESDVANILNESGCGFVVEPENIHAIAMAMKKISAMERSQLQKIGQSGKNYAVVNLSKKANLQKVITVIEISLNK